MKKIVTVKLILNLFFALVIKNYCLGHSFFSSDYYLIEERAASLKHLVEVSFLNEFKGKSNYLLREKSTFPEGNLLSESDDIYLISNSIERSGLRGVENESNETIYSPGEKITVTAEANPGFKFFNWTIDGKEVSRALTYEFIMPSKSINLKANFIKEFEVPSKPDTETDTETDTEKGTGLLNGLVAFYEMNTNLSSVLKDSHGQNHGVNSQISHVQGFSIKGNKYDPKSSISSVPHSNGLNLDTEFTLMADIFREGNGKPDGAVIIGKTYSSAWPENQAYSLAITADNRLRIRTNSAGLRDWFSTQTVPLGKWVRVIATYKSGEGYRLYLDAVTPEKSPQFSGAIAKSDMKLTIGSASLLRNAAYARRFEGVLDNVGIWNRKLSQEEITELITTKITYPDFGSVQEVSKVSVISPVQQAEFDALSNIQIEIELENKNGEFAKVELYNGSSLITTLAEGVSTYSWKGVPTGQYSIKAKAFHNNGTFTESAPVAISVVEEENIVSKPGTGTGLLNGLVAFYEMNTNLSSVLKDSHGQNHGVNSQISHVQGFSIKGNKYDPKSSISSVPHSNGLNLDTEFTLMADIFREGNGKPDGAVIIGKTYSSAWPENQAYSLAITADNRLRIRTNSAGLRDWFSTQTVPLGKWVRVIATYKSGEGYRLYLDAVTPEKSPQFSGAIAKSDMKLTIGSASLLRNAAYARRFEGVLDNVGIWNRKLSQEEITELITTKITYPDFGSVQEVSKVSVISPVQQAEFDALSNIQIEIELENKNGEFAKVELYNGSSLITTLAEGVSTYSWKGVPTGQYSIKAKAFHNNGTFTESAPVAISVVEEENIVSNPGTGTGLLNGLVAFYEMNTNLSSVLKDSHGQNHGVNSQISHVQGFSIKGNKYDPKSSISSVPHSNGLNLDTEFTLMADIFREGNGKPDGAVIIGKTYSSAWPENQAYSLAITADNRLRIRTNSAGLRDWFSTQTVPLGKWVRVIATYKSGEGYRLYLDAVTPEKSPQLSGAIAKSDMKLTIGSASLLRNAAYARRFEGVLDNVGIWNRKLSQEEITELITTKITYPDFKGNELYRVTVVKTTEDLSGEITVASDSTLAEGGEKLIFLVEEEEGVVFDHWSVDEVQVSNSTFYELDVPEKDLILTQHFRTFVAPEISIVLPDERSEFNASSEVHIELEIKKNDAEIEKIEIFNGSDLVRELTQDSSGFDWKDIPEGSHQLVGRITDTDGKTYFSDPVVLKAVGYQSKDVPNVLLDYVIGPNPSSDYLNIIFTNLDGSYDFEFRVVSMNGTVQKTFEARPEESKVTIDVSDLINGVYVLQLTANRHMISSKKFIKK